MGLLDWLIRRAPDDTAPAPSAFRPASRPEIPPPAADEPEDASEQPDETGAIALEPVFTTIDYIDAAGHATRRRITLRSAHTGPVAGVLRAVCHERRALRCFRIDRIDCFIEPDGEVIDAERFLRDTLMIDPTALILPPARRAATRGAASPGRPKMGSEWEAAQSAREQLRAPLSVLVLAARADDEFHPEELDAICRWTETELFALCDAGKCAPPTIDTLDRLTNLISRMRPHARTLPDHLQRVLAMPDDRFARFERALAEVLVADGGIDENERRWVADLATIRAEAKAGRAFDLGIDTPRL